MLESNLKPCGNCSSIEHFIQLSYFDNFNFNLFIRAKKRAQAGDNKKQKNVDLLLPPKEERESKKERKSSHTYTQQYPHTRKHSHSSQLVKTIKVS